MSARNKKEKEMDTSITVKLPIELRDKVAEKSAQTGVSASFVVRRALEDWIKESEKIEAKGKSK